jgi:hypothetical protein
MVVHGPANRGAADGWRFDLVAERRFDAQDGRCRASSARSRRRRVAVNASADVLAGAVCVCGRWLTRVVTAIRFLDSSR